MTRSRRWCREAAATACAWALVIAACGSPSASPEGATVRDSAGVTLVHYGRQAVEGVPVLDPVEVLRIGTLDGPEETQFFALRAAIERDGGIYLLDGGHNEVRVFGADGSFVRSFGREGDGPGEFRRPIAMEFLGDTLVVRDGRRVNLLDANGASLATGPSRAVTEDGFMMRVVPTSIGWLGEWLSSPDQGVPRGEPFQESVSIYHIDRTTGEPADEVFTYPRPQQRVSRGEFPFYVQPYFQAYPSSNVGADGTIYYTPGTEYRIDVIEGATGRLVRRITADPSPAPITDALLDRAVERDRQRVREAPPGSEMAMFGEVIAEKLALGVADNVPVLGRIHSSESGRLLVERLDLDPDPAEAGDPATWDLFDSAGALTGRLPLGSDTRILRLTDDGFLAVVRDELDVQAFVKYRLAGI